MCVSVGHNLVLPDYAHNMPNCSQAFQMVSEWLGNPQNVFAVTNEEKGRTVGIKPLEDEMSSIGCVVEEEEISAGCEQLNDKGRLC